MIPQASQRVKFLKYTRQNESNPLDSSFMIEFWHIWRDLLRTYWSSKLSYPSDSLVAISGIMNDIEESTGRKSYWGLWVDYLPIDLLWACGKPMTTSKLEQFPTWSWASAMDGFLYFPYVVPGDSVGSVEVKVGQPNGFLALKSHLFSAKSLPDRVAKEDGSETVHTLVIGMDTTLPQEASVVASIIVESEVYGSIRRNQEFYASKSVGLLLTSSGQAKNQYRRVGYWQYSIYGPSEDRLRIIQLKADFYQGTEYQEISLV